MNGTYLVRGLRTVAPAFLAALAILSIAITEASACSRAAADGPVMAHEDYVRALDAIVVATRVDETPPSWIDELAYVLFGPVSVDVRVEDWVKGDGPARLTVEGVKLVVGWCGGAFMPDGKVILQLYGEVESGTATLSFAEQYSDDRRERLEAILRGG